MTNEYVVGNTTKCFAQPNTPEYFNDPCCNEGLTWGETCLPRSVTSHSFGGNEFLVSSQCVSSACSTQVATSLAAVTARIASSECGEEAFRSLVEVLDPIGSGAGQVEGICASAFNSGTDEVCVQLP